MNKALKIIDSVSDWTGRLVSWLGPILVALITFEVTMRFVFNRPSMWAYETALMIGTTLYVFAWSYVHRYHEHIRVDIFYSRLSPRGRAIVDIIFALILFIPLYILFAYGSVDWAWKAWKTGEKMTETNWMPPLSPIRTVVAFGVILFVFQGIANFVRDIYLLVRNKNL